MSIPIRAVFFDLGGTLFSYREIPKVSVPLLGAAAERLGVDADLAQVGAAYAGAARKANEDYLDRDYYLHRDLFFDTYRLFAAGLGATPGDDFYEWLYEAQREIMVTRVALRDDCLDTLKQLRDHGLYLSIVSNIDDDYLHPMVANYGLTPFLDHWSSSEEARSCKPHRGIFDWALEKAGARPDEVAFVGDSRHHDVRGARAMGMRSVLIDEGRGRGLLDRGDEEPDHVIEELRELVALLGGEARGVD